MPVPGVFSGSSSSGRASGPDGGFSRCGLGSWRFLSVMILKQNRTRLGSGSHGMCALLWLDLLGPDFAYASLVGLKQPIGIRGRSVPCIDDRARQ